MRKRKLRAKYLAAVLAVILAVGLVPTSVLAQKEGGQNTSNSTGSDQDRNGGPTDSDDNSKGDDISDNTSQNGDSTNNETPGGRPDGSNGAGDRPNGGNEAGRPDGGNETGRPNGGNEAGRPNGGTSYSDSVLTVPAELSDGTYAGTSTVQADENENFTNYTIRVSVTVADGKISTVYVSGAGGSNLAYSNDALEGITRQVTSNSAGEYDIDAVTSATCSSKAIIKGMNAALEGTPSLTTYSVNDGSSNVTYLPSGSKFTVTVTNPIEGVDYRNIGLAYGVGKFADDMKAGDDFSVSRISITDTEVTYEITINPESFYEINDDGLIHSELYNTPGRNLTLTVGEEGLGTVYIKSAANLAINNNVISLTGGNGETLSEYLTLVDEVTVSYKDEDGEEKSTTYSTRWQHDMDPAFTGTELFNADGSINFDIIAEVTRQGEDFEAVKDENGNNITYTEKVFPYGADWDYYLTLTAGDGYDEVSAWVGADYAAPGTDTPDTGNQNTGNQNAGNQNTGNQNTNNQSANAKDSNNNSTAAASNVKTGDTANWYLWAAVMAIAVLVVAVTFKKRHSFKK